MGKVVKDDSGNITGYLLTPEEHEFAMAMVWQSYDEELAAEAKRQIESGEADRTGWTTERVLEMLRTLDSDLPPVKP